MPYTDATQSGVIPVAFAYHTLVIVTRVGSLSKVVEDQVSGIFILPKDSQALFEKMKWSLENRPVLEKSVSNAYEVTTKKLDWQEIAKKLLEVGI